MKLVRTYMKLVRLMVRVSPKHKKALAKAARKASTRDVKVSESEVVRSMLDVYFGKV